MPKKHLAQHFLSDPRILDRIVRFAQIDGQDAVVEIGPGRGSLTAALAGKARRVIAIEIDRALAADLRDQAIPNVDVIEADALGIDYTALHGVPYHIVANLPYNVATALIERFLAARHRILAVTVMVQKEVAARILAPPNTRSYGVLSVGVRYYAEVEAGFVVPPGAFSPPPKVWSQMIRLTWRPGVGDSPRLMALVGKAFAARRKKLVNNLAPAFPGRTRGDWVALLEGVGIDSDARAENLSIDDFVRLHQSLER